MSLTSIIAFLSVLTAFNIPADTVAQIRDILIPPVATTTIAITPVPVQQTPIIPNQPVYFGSSVPSNPQPTQPAPVVQPAPVTQETPADTTAPKILDSEIYTSVYRDLGRVQRFKLFTDEPVTIAFDRGQSTTTESRAATVDKKDGYFYQGEITGVQAGWEVGVPQFITLTVTDNAGNATSKLIQVR